VLTYRRGVSSDVDGANETPTKPPAASESDASSRLSRRSGIWLTTLSTVVAVATGMFTLRDQIFPQQSPDAQASVSFYEQSIDDVCSALNDAEKLRGKNERQLARRLRRTDLSTLGQRNALLDSVRQIVENSEHVFADFKGHDAPRMLRAPAHKTVVAWTRIIAVLHGYSERLGVARTRRDLNAAIRTLRGTRTRVAAYRLDRASGLTRLGGGRCKLDPPITSPTMVLPAVTPPADPVNPPPGSPPRIAPDPNQPVASSPSAVIPRRAELRPRPSPQDPANPPPGLGP
jgi:hypothetical protein